MKTRSKTPCSSACLYSRMYRRRTWFQSSTLKNSTTFQRESGTVALLLGRMVRRLIWRSTTSWSTWVEHCALCRRNQRQVPFSHCQTLITMKCNSIPSQQTRNLTTSTSKAWSSNRLARVLAVAVSSHSATIVPCLPRTSRTCLGKTWVSLPMKTRKQSRSFLTESSQSSTAGKASSSREVKWRSRICQQQTDWPKIRDHSKIEEQQHSSA